MTPRVESQNSRRIFLKKLFLSLAAAIPAASVILGPDPAIAKPPSHDHCGKGHKYERMKKGECICGRYIVTVEWYCSICLGLCYTEELDQGSC